MDRVPLNTNPKRVRRKKTTPVLLHQLGSLSFLGETLFGWCYRESKKETTNVGGFLRNKTDRWIKSQYSNRASSRTGAGVPGVSFFEGAAKNGCCCFWLPFEKPPCRENKRECCKLSPTTYHGPFTGFPLLFPNISGIHRTVCRSCRAFSQAGGVTGCRGRKGVVAQLQKESQQFQLCPFAFLEVLE